MIAFAPPPALRRWVLRQEIAALRAVDRTGGYGMATHLTATVMVLAAALVAIVFAASLMIDPGVAAFLGLIGVPPIIWYWITVPAWLREAHGATDPIARYALLRRREAEMAAYDA